MQIKTKTTLLAAAVLAASMAHVQVAQAEDSWIPTFPSDDYWSEDGKFLDSTGTDASLKKWEKGQKGCIVADLSNKNTSLAFMTSVGGDIKNEGEIWVTTTVDSDFYGSALNVYDGHTGINDGIIYVDSRKTGSNVERQKGMIVSKSTNGTSSKIINNGTIIARNGSGMSLATGKGSAEILNNGTIQVESAGYGITLGGDDASDATVVNKGTIHVKDNAVGMSTSDAIKGTFTNAGTIKAEGDSAKAIVLGSGWDGIISGVFTLNLEKGSQIDGTVQINGKDTTLNANEVNDSFKLSASKITKTTLIASQLGVEGDGKTTIGTLTMDDDSVLNVLGDRKLTVGSLDGDNIASFTFDHFGTDGNKVLDIENNTLKSTHVEFTADAVDGHTADEVVGLMKDSVDLGTMTADKATSHIEGNGTNFEVDLIQNTDGSFTTNVTGSDITKQTADLAALSLVAWRNETTTITDRMASLRTNPQTYGAWVRWNGGEYKYDDRDLSNEFNTIEVGGDIKVAPNWVLGASFAYTKGDGDFMQGETESDAYSGALYALWTHEQGSFVDMVMKAGRISTDFDFYNLHGGAADNGTLDQTGFILSVETGHRFALPMNTFVEPQIQLQYSRLSSVDETTAERRVKLDSSNSLIGRVGVMAGIECPNDRGTLWLKASALRDFKGDVDGKAAMADGTSPFEIHQELDQSWGELALGADFKVTDNVYTFADVQKSFGGDIELDWRANVGAKFVW